jgi:hypothetical protein
MKGKGPPRNGGGPKAQAVSPAEERKIKCTPAAAGFGGACKRPSCSRAVNAGTCPRHFIVSPLNDDISPSAGNYSLDLRLLRLRHSELVKCLLEIVEKGLPLRRRDHEMPV